MNFYIILQRTRIWVMVKIVTDFSIEKKLITFVWIWIVSIRERITAVHFTEKHSKELFSPQMKILQKSSIWVIAEIVPDFSMKEVESFCFHLHCIYKGKTKQRSKICSTRKWEFYKIFQKTRIWVMAEKLSRIGQPPYIGGSYLPFHFL